MDIAVNRPIDAALIGYRATPGAAAVIASMARTEHLEFSPDRRWIAVAGFRNNAIYLLAADIRRVADVPAVDLTGALILRSDRLREPHGLAFMGPDHLAVANRDGNLEIFSVPDHGGCDREVWVRPVATIESSAFCRVRSPGSVLCLPTGPGSWRLLACNNYIDTVTAHDVALRNGRAPAVRNRGVLLRRRLAIPDGICLSPDGAWLAISNHSSGSILIYRNSRRLGRWTAPSGELLNIVCPHALRFSADGTRLFVADSASAYMHVYHAPDGDWRGTQRAETSLRILADDVFRRGRYNAQEGGIKGLDIDCRHGIFAVSSEHYPLAFYDLDTALALPAVSAEGEMRDMARLRDAEMRAFYAGTAAPAPARSGE